MNSTPKLPPHNVLRAVRSLGRATRLALFAGVLAACGAGAPRPGGPGSPPTNESSASGTSPPAPTTATTGPSAPANDGPGADPAPPGSGCTKQSDCREGELCDGPVGCGVKWKCVPGRSCTKDIVTYCACDGTTFEGSGSCPGRPVRRRGGC